MIDLLYVDDNEGDRAMAFESCIGSDFKIHCVDNAETALDEVQNNHYGIVVCDMMMPGDDGLYFAKRMSEMALNVALVLISGLPSLKGFGEYKGFNNYLGFILKPITPEKIKKLMG